MAGEFIQVINALREAVESNPDKYQRIRVEGTSSEGKTVLQIFPNSSSSTNPINGGKPLTPATDGDKSGVVQLEEQLKKAKAEENQTREAMKQEAKGETGKRKVKVSKQPVTNPEASAKANSQNTAVSDLQRQIDEYNAKREAELAEQERKATEYQEKIAKQEAEIEKQEVAQESKETKGTAEKTVETTEAKDVETNGEKTQTEQEKARADKKARKEAQRQKDIEIRDNNRKELDELLKKDKLNEAEMEKAEKLANANGTKEQKALVKAKKEALVNDILNSGSERYKDLAHEANEKRAKLTEELNKKYPLRNSDPKQAKKYEKEINEGFKKIEQEYRQAVKGLNPKPVEKVAKEGENVIKKAKNGKWGKGKTAIIVALALLVGTGIGAGIMALINNKKDKKADEVPTEETTTVTEPTAPKEGDPEFIGPVQVTAPVQPAQPEVDSTIVIEKNKGITQAICKKLGLTKEQISAINKDKETLTKLEALLKEQQQKDKYYTGESNIFGNGHTNFVVQPNQEIVFDKDIWTKIVALLKPEEETHLDQVA